MPGQRGVARRTTPRRRTLRTRIKSGYPVYVRRFKMLLFSKQGKGKFLVDTFSTGELAWELTVLDKLEQMCYAILEPYGFSKEVQDYYLGYAKRLWEMRVKFADATFQLEKQSLLYEYTQRGLDPLILAILQNIPEELSKYKVADVTIYPFADAYVDETFPDDNHGGEDEMLINTQIGNNQRSFLKFTLELIQKEISKVFLRFYVLDYFTFVWPPPPPPIPPSVTYIECREVPTLEFDEYVITWNNQPAYGNIINIIPTVFPTVELLSPTFMECDVTDYVKAQKLGPGIATFCLKFVTEDYDGSTRALGVCSRETLVAGFPAPALRIYYKSS